MIVRPFRGLRPRADLAALIPSLPYDVLDSDEARALAHGDPYTFLHVVKPEVDLDPGIPVHDDRVYSKARENFDLMRERGWLVRDPNPSYYVYRLAVGRHVQTGVVGVCAAADYREGRIRRHEHTRPEKEDDRTRHAEALGAHPGPVFLAHRGSKVLESLASEAAAGPPVAAFVAPDGVAHSLWRVDDPQRIERIALSFEQIPSTYIADGHHRAAAYARVAASRGASAGPAATGRDGSDFFLAVHFPASELRILDYNRLVRDLNGLDAQSVIGKIRENGFEVRQTDAARRPTRAGSYGMYVAGLWYLIVAKPGIVPADDAVRRLDVAVLSERILGPVLGIADPRTDPRIDFVGGIRGMEELQRRVDSGAYAAAFSLHPTRIEDVMDVADAGRVMPPKSTWFEPKLRSGMVIHLFDDEPV